MHDVSLMIEAREIEPGSACRRVMNFGQNWRGRHVVRAHYTLRFPVALLIGEVDRVRPEYRADSEEFPDTEDGLERVWRELEWSPGEVAVQTQGFLEAFVDMWGPELLDLALPNDASEVVWHLNTVDSVVLSGETVVLTGIAGRGEARWQALGPDDDARARGRR